MPDVFAPSPLLGSETSSDSYPLPLRLAFWWFFVTAVGGTMLASLPFKVNGENIADMVAFLCVCAAQWLLLRSFVPKVSGWFWLSLLGGLIGLFLGILPADRVQDAIDGVKISPLGIAGIGEGRSALGFFVASAVMGAGFGAGLGLFQWFDLRWRFAKADWWILASAVGFTGSMALNGLVGMIPFEAAHSLNLELVPPGLTTALALNWLVAKSSPKVIESMPAKRPRIRISLAQSPAEMPKLPPRPLGVSILAAAAFVGAAGGIRVLLLSIKEKPQTAVIAVFFAIGLLVAPPLIAGIGLLKQRGWARSLVLFIAVWSLLCLPFAYELVTAGFAVCWVASFVLITWYLCRPRVIYSFRKSDDDERVSLL